MKPLSLYEWHQITFLMSDLERIALKIKNERLNQTRAYFEMIFKEKENRLLAYAQPEFNQLLNGTGVTTNPNQ